MKHTSSRATADLAHKRIGLEAALMQMRSIGAPADAKSLARSYGLPLHVVQTSMREMKVREK